VIGDWTEDGLLSQQDHRGHKGGRNLRRKNVTNGHEAGLSNRSPELRKPSGNIFRGEIGADSKQMRFRRLA
jgi:hypothetical protein